MESALAPFSGAEFVTGLRHGLVMMTVGPFALGLPHALRRRGVSMVFGGPVPVAGLVLAVAFGLALQATLGLSAGLSIGLVAVAAGGMVGDVGRAGLGQRVWLLVPGAWLIATDPRLVDDSWVRLLVGLAVAGLGPLVANFDERRQRSGLGPALFGLSTVGVYLTLPDTEHALVLLGVALPVALLGWPLPMASLGVSGAPAAVACLAWTVGVDGGGRASSVVGGLACLGLLVVEPLTRVVAEVLAGGREPSRRPWASRPLPLGMAHGGLVLVASRVAGLQPSLSAATAVVLVVAGSAVGLGGALLAGRVGGAIAASRLGGVSYEQTGRDEEP